MRFSWQRRVRDDLAECTVRQPGNCTRAAYGPKVRTVVFEQQGGKWLVVHEHISAPLQ